MLSALWTPAKIIEIAKWLEQDAIAITDYNAWYGLLEFYEKAGSIKPILWVDINFSYDGKEFMNIVLLAKDYTWYKNLIKLISIANTTNFKTTPYINMENAKIYYSQIKDVNFIDFKNKWHFNEWAWILELKEILDYLD